MMKLRIFKWTFALCFLLIYSVTAEAVGTLPTDFSSKISQVDVRSNGYFLIWFTGSITGSSNNNCRQHSQSMTGNANTAGGKIVLSGALAAWTTKSAVWAQGTGNCNEYSDYESIILLQMQ